jgi:NAD-dependent deacetylase
VVWFEETLPEEALARAVRLCNQADVMLVIGTSGMVYPAALLPHNAHAAGAIILEINPNASELSPIAKIRLPYPSGEILPEVLRLMREMKRV